MFGLTLKGELKTACIIADKKKFLGQKYSFCDRQTPRKLMVLLYWG